MNIEQTHINLLGNQVKEKVTGMKGVVTSICFDLYGCIQACVTPNNPDKASKWFDVTRLEIKKRVIEVPSYSRGYIAKGRKGAADKPSQLKEVPTGRTGP